MAAILCHGMNRMCTTTCTKASTLPCCTSDNTGIAESVTENHRALPETSVTLSSNKSNSSSWWHMCCNACSASCSSCSCNWCQCNPCRGCMKSLSALKHICTNPFGIFVTVTVVSNIPPMLIALTEVGHFGAQGGAVCPASIWLLTNFLFCWVHIIASFYIAVSINHRLQLPAPSAPQGGGGGSSTGSRRTILKRASNLFCYDPVMAVYIMTVCLYAGFLLIPKVLLNNNTNNYGDNDNYGDDDNNYGNNNNNANDASCTIYIHEKVGTTVGFAWAFLVFGVGALGLSFGFAYVDANRQSKRRHHSHESGNETDGTISGDDDIESVTQGTDYTTMDEGGGYACTNHKKIGRPRVVLKDYNPPMIMNLSTTENGTDIEMMSTTEETCNTKANTVNTLTDAEGGFSTDMDTVGFVTDFETDVEDVHLARTAARGRGRSNTQKNNYMPMTSYEGQESETEGGFTTDRYDTTDGDDGGDGGDSFETSIDLTTTTTTTGREFDHTTPTNSFRANLDIVLALSQDPTVSMALTDQTRTTDDGDDESGGVGRGGSSVGTGSKRSFVRLARKNHKNTENDGDNPLKRVVDLVSNHSSSSDDDTNDKYATRNPSLAYSTSIGSAMGGAANEALSFVDGGGSAPFHIPDHDIATTQRPY